jgi:hypothetical protein
MKALVYGGLAAWFAAALAASLTGALRSVPSPVLLIGGFVAAVIVFVAGYAGSGRFREYVRQQDARRVTAMQALRITGVIFYIWYALGRLPASFGIVTGTSDVMVGLTALLAAHHLSEHVLRRWHLFGIGGLVLSGGIGILTAPPAMSGFPLSLVPTFLGPLMLLLHLTALQSLPSAVRLLTRAAR